MIDKASFLAIYKNTNYIIPELHTKIKIDELNAIIDSELLKSNHSYWAFISAANPFSKEISDQENEFNFLKLKISLTHNFQNILKDMVKDNLVGKMKNLF